MGRGDFADRGRLGHGNRRGLRIGSSGGTARVGRCKIIAAALALALLQGVRGVTPSPFGVADVTSDGFKFSEFRGDDFEHVATFEVAALGFVGALQAHPGLGDLGDEHHLVIPEWSMSPDEIVAKTVDREAGGVRGWGWCWCWHESIPTFKVAWGVKF